MKLPRSCGSINISHLSNEVCHNIFFSHPLISARCGCSSSGNHPHFSATGTKHLGHTVGSPNRCEAQLNTRTSHLCPIPCLGLCHGVLAALRTTKPARVQPWGVGEAAAEGSGRQRSSQLSCMAGPAKSRPSLTHSGFGKQPVEPSLSPGIAAPLQCPSSRNWSN